MSKEGYKNKCILICGLPGVGKSTLANALSKKLNAKILRTDEIRDELFSSPLLTKLDNSGKNILDSDISKFMALSEKELMKINLQSVLFYLNKSELPEEFKRFLQQLIEKQKKIVYEEFYKRLESMLEKHNVILDATFSSESSREAVKRIGEKCNASYYVIKCVCDESIVRKRLERSERLKRERAGSKAGIYAYEIVKKSWQEISDEHLTVDCSEPLKNNLRIVLSYINNRF